MSKSSAKRDADLAIRLLKPEILPPDFLSYMQDYNAVNMAPIPLSQIVGAEFYSRQLEASATVLDVVSDATERTIFSVDIQANTLDTAGMVQIILNGDYLNNSGLARTFILKVKYGATTMFQDTSPSIVVNANRATLYMRFELAAADSKTAQNLFGRVEMSTRTAPTTGIGSISTIVPLIAATVGGSAAEDSAVTKTFSVTLQHSASHASLSYRRKSAVSTKIGH